MNEKPRFVFDNGVLVGSAIKANSIPRKAIELAFAIGEVLVSVATIAELTNVLRRPKLSPHLTPLVREKFLAEIVLRAIDLVPTEIIRECRDPKDDMFLELAITGNASCLVSGDQDLLVLHPFRSIPILTPRTFLEIYGPLDPSPPN